MSPDETGTSDGAESLDLTPQQSLALGRVLDVLIPARPDGRLPGAGELGLAAALLARAPELRDGILAGLAALDALGRARGAEDFAALSPAGRTDALRELETRQPDFLGGLIFQTFAIYYQDPRVLEALGLEPRPPYPTGYELAPSDPDTLLERVRRRSKLYRE